MVTPSQRRTVVNFLQASYGVSERRGSLCTSRNGNRRATET